jgi:type 2 lantibiotic biosynthesis protein LanM
MTATAAEWQKIAPKADFREIAAQAAFLYERAGADYVPAPAREGDDEAEERLLNQWRSHAALGDEENFRKRLVWDGLTIERAKNLLRGVRLREDAPLPAWAKCLEEAMELAGNLALLRGAELEIATQPQSEPEPIPFHHILLPFQHYATRQLQSICPEGYALVSEAAQVAFERALLQTLSGAASAVLQLEFSAWLALQSGPESHNEGYRAFVRHMLSGGLWETITQYPVMGRMLAQATLLWCAFTGELFKRLVADLPALEHAFGRGKPLGRVKEVGPHLSDYHNGNTCVVRLTFESGVTCYYKPKNIDSERQYNALLKWFNDNTALLPFRPVETVCRERHGWVESVPMVPMSNEEEARRYFERMGMMLCVLYALGANDCIVDNIVPQGEHPVLIDAETFFQPLPNLAHKSMWGAASVANRNLFHDSVIRVGMLPRWVASPEGRKNDISALGGFGGERGEFQKKIWDFVNTDRMRCSWQTKQVSFPPQLLNGKPILAHDYVEQIVKGFTNMYWELAAHREALLEPSGPIGRMKDFKLRFLVRATYVYDALIQAVQTPKYQTDGALASIYVDSISRQYLLAEQRPVAWPVIAFEHRSILQLDVPRFATTPLSDALDSGGEWIKGFFVEPRFDSSSRLMMSMGASDLALQVAYIRCAFTPPYQFWVNGTEVSGQVHDDHEVLEQGEAINEALEIAHMIERSAIHGSDGSVTWITHGYNPDSQFSQIQPMGFRLYDGALGTGLFLAAVHKAVSTNGFRDLALASFRVLTDTASKPVRFVLLHDGLGGGLGVASIVYSLMLAGQLLEERSLIQQAERVAELITPDSIESDRRLDLLGGAAGCLLVLLELYKVSKKERILQLATDCGEHLLATRSLTPTGALAWSTIQGKHLAGFSHGAAGIGLALARLSQMTGYRRYRQAVDDAYAYENTLFDASARNWSNLLSPPNQRFWNSWCHGAPGVGLARLGSMRNPGDTAYQKDLDCALERAATGPLNTIDHLCCGTLGRIEVLLEAERILGRHDCGDQARRIAKQVVRNARKRGRYNFGLDVGIYVPSFHQGMAGIGYQLLRATDPVGFPSVLSWQSAPV